MILIGNYKVFLTHGNYYYVQSGLADIKSVAKSKGCGYRDVRTHAQAR